MLTTRETYDLAYNALKAYACDYPNYIFALTMGTGKTIGTASHKASSSLIEVVGERSEKFRGIEEWRITL